MVTLIVVPRSEALSTSNVPAALNLGANGRTKDDLPDQRTDNLYIRSGRFGEDVVIPGAGASVEIVIHSKPSSGPPMKQFRIVREGSRVFARSSNTTRRGPISLTAPWVGYRFTPTPRSQVA